MSQVNGYENYNNYQQSTSAFSWDLLQKSYKQKEAGGYSVEGDIKDK